MKKALLLLLFVCAPAFAKIESFTLPDHEYGRERKVWVFTPASYDAKAKTPYNVLLLFDGEAYIEDIPAPKTIEQLMAKHAIAPTMAVMIDNSADRLGDLANRQKFADFLAQELVPWVRAHYRITSDPHGVIAGGASAGGLAAAYVAFRHPEAIGGVLSQSGAFWRGNEGAGSGEWLTEAFRNAKPLGIRFSIEVGAGETHRVLGGTGPAFIDAVRRLRDVLRAKGYEVHYTEVPGAQHEPGHWSAAFADALTAIDAPAR